MQNKSVGPVDATLKLVALAGSLTVTTTNTSISISQGSSVFSDAYPDDDGGIPMMVAIPITSYDATTGDESYSFRVQVSSDNTTWTDASRTATIGGASVTVTDTIDKALGGLLMILAQITQPYVRVIMVLAGTTPIINIGDTYLQPFVNAAG